MKPIILYMRNFKEEIIKNKCAKLPSPTVCSWPNTNFKDDIVPVFAACIMTSLSLFNIGLLKLNGFLNSDGSVQEQPAD